MKQLLAIAFIIILAFSQYARQFNYIECKLANSLKPSSQHCDCEKLNTGDNLSLKEFPAPRTHVHQTPDEFYTTSGNSFPEITCLLTPTKAAAFNPGEECKGCLSGPDRPPCI